MTTTALRNATSLGFDRGGVVRTINGIDRAMFPKSLTTLADHRVWLDVYHVPARAIVLHVKFQADVITEFQADGLLLWLFEDDGRIVYRTPAAEVTDLRLFFDRGVIEVFANGGLLCGTRRSYQVVDLASLSIDAAPSTLFDVWEYRSAWSRADRATPARRCEELPEDMAIRDLDRHDPAVNWGRRQGRCLMPSAPPLRPG